MDSDRAKWNKLFAAKASRIEDKPPAAPSFIQQHHTDFPPGRVLDIASGDGAVSLYLAQQGFQVTAADISATALNRLTRFASSQSLLISTLEIDFDAPASLSELGPFDGIVISRYKPPITLWSMLAKCLHPGGRLLISTFNHRHHFETGFSERFCLQPGELLTIHPDLEIVRYQSIKRDQGDLDEYLMEKPGNSHRS